MSEDERLDVIEGTDEDGNKLLLEVVKYFFYNGDEYVLLCECDDECACEECACEDETCQCSEITDACACGEACECDECDECGEEALYVMRVVPSKDEDGEDIEEFVPVDPALMEKLIEVVRTNFNEEDDDEVAEETLPD